MGDFDSVKLGVCDAYWTPANGDPLTDEIFLGLTKGGCELTYTPEWYDLQVDRYGKSPTDASLVGEAISVKIPLAETDLAKINLFAHTATKVNGNDAGYKLTFGKFPGFRLSNVAGRLRLHPVSNGTNKGEDVILYKAVNKAPLQLNYKLDEERIFQTEFMGMINRSHINTALLWEIGDSTIGTSALKLSSTLDANGLPTNLMTMVAAAGSSIWIGIPETPVQTNTDANLRTASLKAYAEFNGNVYNITPLTTFSLSPTAEGAWYNGEVLCEENGGRLPTSAPDLGFDYVTASQLGSIVNKDFIAVNKAAFDLIKPYNLKTYGADKTLVSNWEVTGLGKIFDVQVLGTAGGVNFAGIVKVQVTN